jgi:hypothetical protein
VYVAVHYNALVYSYDTWIVPKCVLTHNVATTAATASIVTAQVPTAAFAVTTKVTTAAINAAVQAPTAAFNA